MNFFRKFFLLCQLGAGNVIECDPYAAMDGGCHLLDQTPNDWVTTACVPGRTLTMEGICVEDCDVGFYLFGSTCLPCTPNCNVCYGPNDFQCSTCDARYALNSQSVCSFKCDVGGGEYGSPATGATCNACDTTCTTCSGGFQTSCLSCPPSTDGFTYTLYPTHYSVGYTNAGFCIRDPGVDYGNFFRQYPNDMVIRECPVGCLTCRGMFNCESCITGYNLFPPTGTAAYALCYSNV